jgi:hypothetical protein
METVTLDGKKYRLRLKYGELQRAFSLPDGPNADEMFSGRHERDLWGTYYNFSLSVEPHPQYQTDYDDFYEAISAPQDSHTITLPYAQKTITFEAMVSGGTDYYKGKLGGVKRWGGLTVTFESIKPVRTPT